MNPHQRHQQRSKVSSLGSILRASHTAAYESLFHQIRSPDPVTLVSEDICTLQKKENQRDNKSFQMRN